MPALGAPLDPRTVDLTGEPAPLRRRQRVVEGLECRVLEAGVRAGVAERDPNVSVVGALHKQLAEDRFAILARAGLQQVPAAHLARHKAVTAASLERLGLQLCRQLVLTDLGGGIRQLVIEVTEWLGQYVAPTGKAVELRLGSYQRRSVDVRLEDRFEGHPAIVNPPSAALGEPARSFRAFPLLGEAVNAMSQPPGAWTGLDSGGAPACRMVR